MVYVACNCTDQGCLWLRLFILLTVFPSHIFVLAHSVATHIHTHAHAPAHAHTHSHIHSLKIFDIYKSQMKTETFI
jgi:hypothetical protein